MKITLWQDTTLRFYEAKLWLRKAFRWCFDGSHNNILLSFLRNNIIKTNEAVNEINGLYMKCNSRLKWVNSFHGTGLFLYPLKIFKKLEIVWCFQGVLKENSSMTWDNRTHITLFKLLYLSIWFVLVSYF